MRKLLIPLIAALGAKYITGQDLSITEGFLTLEECYKFF